MKALTKNEIIDELAKEDSFFEIANKSERGTLSAYFHNSVWGSGPYLVTILNKDVTAEPDLIRNMTLILHDNEDGVFTGPVAAGALFKKTTMDNRADWSTTRPLYAFNNSASAEHFALQIEEKLGVEARSFQLTDAGPDTRIFTPH